MKPADKKLLLRIATRMEKVAVSKFEAAIAANPARVDEAKRTRDTELGDVRDLRAYSATASADEVEAARFRYLIANPGFLHPGITGDGTKEFIKRLDADIAKPQVVHGG